MWSKGIDYGSRRFSLRRYLLSNVKLRVLDAFGPVPANLRHKYDIVHIALFCLVIRLPKYFESLLQHLLGLFGW